MRTLLSAVLVLLLGRSLDAEEVFTIPRDRSWDAWNYPRGLVTVASDGVRVKRFTGAYNALADAAQYQIPAIGSHGERVARTATNALQVDRVHDQRADTYWKPDPGAPLADWWVEIDLRRIVLADQVRLVFPDAAGARPFRFFSVYTSPGLEVATAPGSVYFTRVGGTIKANTSQVVEYPLAARNPSGATGQYLVESDVMSFEPVRFIRFQAEGLLEDAALAEIEVRTIGENIALRIEDWGGRITST
ncbi:MAG: hypothetical protein AB1505_31300, partial [Candidatus Latescibacterota bacterium]